MHPEPGPLAGHPDLQLLAGGRGGVVVAPQPVVDPPAAALQDAPAAQTPVAPAESVANNPAPPPTPAPVVDVTADLALQPVVGALDDLP